MKKKALVFVLIAILLIVGFSFYISGNIGIAEDKIITSQLNTVSWNTQDYDVQSSSDGKSLYVGVIYLKDYSNAKYFIYIKKDGLSFGWHFLQGGSLSDADGIRAFDCGEYGTAYIALNKTNAVCRFEFEDGRDPSIIENVGSLICEYSKSVIHFYDAAGNLVEPMTLTLKK